MEVGQCSDGSRQHGRGSALSCCSGLCSCLEASPSSSSSSRSRERFTWWPRFRSSARSCPSSSSSSRDAVEPSSSLSKLAVDNLNSVLGTSSDSNLQTRIDVKKALVKACLLEFAQRDAKTKRSADARSIRREAVLLGHEPVAFASPKRTFREAGSGSSRNLVPAMVLPRWESWEVFSTEGVEAGKLRMLQVKTPSKVGGLRRLSCLLCHRATGGGEAILALPCAHVFCPVCFETFLRKRWADLANNLVDSSETEQIPCPSCSTTLQRQDVHTLTEPEVVELAARVELANQLSDKPQPSPSASSVAVDSATVHPRYPVEPLQAKQDAREQEEPTTQRSRSKSSERVGSATSPIAVVAVTPQNRTPPSNIVSQRQRMAAPVAPLVNRMSSQGLLPNSSVPSNQDQRSLYSPQQSVSTQPTSAQSPVSSSKCVTSGISKSMLSKTTASVTGALSGEAAIESKPLVDSTNQIGIPVAANGVTSKSRQIQQPASFKQPAAPGPVSPASGFRPYNVQIVNSQHQTQTTPPLPHRSVSMPMQPGDASRSLQQTNGNGFVASVGPTSPQGSATKTAAVAPVAPQNAYNVVASHRRF